MGFIRRWRLRRAEKDFYKKLGEPQPFVQKGPILTTKMAETVPQGEITGFYQNLKGMMQDAIEVKKKTQDAAARITNAIGAPPEEHKRKA